MAVSSYGRATKTSGVVRILKDLDIDLTGRHVLIVEDILDSGLTLSYLRKSLRAAVRRASPSARCSSSEAFSRGRTSSSPMSVPYRAEFVVGYGLDVAERYRNLSGHSCVSGRRARVTSLPVEVSLAAGPVMSVSGDASVPEAHIRGSVDGSGSAGRSASS